MVPKTMAMISLRKYRVRLRDPQLWIRAFIIGLTLVLIGHVVIQTVGDLETYPGIDLRAKVIGARLLIRGLNPYYDARYEMHSDHLRMLSEDTYSPALLLFYAPLCEASWNTQRIVYFCADWVCILLCFLILSRSFPKSASRVALWLAFVLLFIAGLGFRLHLERGQYYVELALLTCLVAVYSVRKSDSWFHALPLALLVLFRPTYAICILCLLVLRRARPAAVAASVCLALFAFTLPLAGMRSWKNYIKEIRFNQLETAGAAYALVPTPPSAVQSQIVEGIDLSRSLSYPGYLADRTLTGVARSSVSPTLARLVHRVAPSEREFERLNTISLLLMFCFDLAVMVGLSRGPGAGLIPIAFIFLAPLNLELFAPQRFGYCDVTILAPLLLVLATVLERRGRAGWALYGMILTAGFALPWLAFHFDAHVPLVSFLQYVGVLAVLNVVCIMEAWGRRRFVSTRPALDEEEIGLGSKAIDYP